MRYKELFTFMKERHNIYLRRQRGEPKPWTKDFILQQYKFCNIYRELDTVSIWIRENWRLQYRVSNFIWFVMAVARYINWPETLTEISDPLYPWNAKQVCKVLNRRRNAGEQVFGGAYFLNSIGPKIESIVNDRLDLLWKNRKLIIAQIEDVASLEETYEVLKQQYGFGSFMAAQVVADLKYTPRFAEDRMHDWWTFAASGPGSKRGLARVFGREIVSTVINYARAPERRLRASWNEREWMEHMLLLKAKIDPLILKAKMPALSMSDLQGSLCEYDKYERARLGEGRPKAKYPGL